jgi:hypothetical protein
MQWCFCEEESILRTEKRHRDIVQCAGRYKSQQLIIKVMKRTGVEEDEEKRPQYRDNCEENNLVQELMRDF